MEMEEQYGLSDLRQLITRSTPTGPQPPAQFPPYPPPPPDLFSAQHQHQHHHHHHNNTNNNNNNNTTTPTAQLDMVVMGRHVTADILHQGMSRDRFNSDTTPGGAAVVFGGSSGFDSGAARWPRQETLTLLEVRSRLDHKFKEANQKGPLWDEVARIMSEEHGYQRSGKKCREKFENLYKYYKKTKEGKAGRQDGKHYRFFRQLEALYGDHSSSSSHHHHHHHHQRVISSVSDTYIDGNTPHYHPNNNSISPSANTATIIGGGEASLSLSSDFATSSSSDDEDGSSESERKKKRKGKQRSWKAKIKEFIDLQMRKIMEKQEAWLEKMMKAIEKRELERREREEEWKKQEIARIEREHKFWAGERAWIEARDTALMKALNKITSGDHLQGGHHWAEPEITKLIQLRTAMESRFEQCGFSEEVLWEDIAAKMAYFGYERSSTICKDKWDCITKELQDKGNLVKKRKDKNKNNISNNDTNYGVISNHNGGGLYINHHHQHVISGLNHGNNCEINEPRLQLNDGSSSSPSSHNSNVNVNVGNVMNDSCLRFFLGDGDHNLGWESNYGVKTQHGS